MMSNYQGVLGLLMDMGLSWLFWIAVAALSWALLRPSARRRARQEALREALRAAEATGRPRHA
jgi:hypothetical protein